LKKKGGGTHIGEIERTSRSAYILSGKRRGKRELEAKNLVRKTKWSRF